VSPRPIELTTPMWIAWSARPTRPSIGRRVAVAIVWKSRRSIRKYPASNILEGWGIEQRDMPCRGGSETRPYRSLHLMTM